MNKDENTPQTGTDEAGQDDPELENRVKRMVQGGAWGKYTRMVLAALGCLPWVGPLFASATSYWADKGQAELNELYRQWLEQHHESMKKLQASLIEMITRLEQLNEDIEQRIQSEAYLSLVRRAFKVWDQAETDEKRKLIERLLTNAASSHICSDDVVRLFIDWIERYHEIHFKVIRQVFNNEGIARGDIWAGIHGEQPREDSSEADLFKLLIHELSLGHIIRQHRPVDAYGNFRKKKTPRKKTAAPVMKSAFDNNDEYELTELGKQFVHYVLSEAVPRIGESDGQTTAH